MLRLNVLQNQLKRTLAGFSDLEGRLSVVSGGRHLREQPQYYCRI